MAKPENARSGGRALVVIAIAASIWFLRESASVTLPLAFALLTVGAVWPLKDWLSRRLPDWLGLTLTLAVLLVAIGGFALALYISAAEVLSQLQSSKSALSHAYRELSGLAASPSCAWRTGRVTGPSEDDRGRSAWQSSNVRRRQAVPAIDRR